MECVAYFVSVPHTNFRSRLIISIRVYSVKANPWWLKNLSPKVGRRRSSTPEGLVNTIKALDLWCNVPTTIRKFLRNSWEFRHRAKLLEISAVFFREKLSRWGFHETSQEIDVKGWGMRTPWRRCWYDGVMFPQNEEERRCSGRPTASDSIWHGSHFNFSTHPSLLPFLKLHFSYFRDTSPLLEKVMTLIES